MTTLRAQAAPGKRAGVAGRPPAARRRGSLARRRHRMGILYVAPAVALTLALTVAPVLMTAAMSLYEWSLLGTPTFLGLDNYQRLLEDPAFADSLGFTAVYTVLVTIVLLLAGMGLASLVRVRRRGSALLRTVAVVPVVIGFATASYIVLWLLDGRIGVVNQVLRDLGVVEEPVSWFADTETALAVVTVFVVWKTVGLTMLLLLAGMHAIPGDVYEAAALDGAGRWRQFRHVTLPLLRPTIAVVLVLTVIGSVLAFDQFFILTRGGPDGTTTPVVFSIYRAAFVDFDLGYAAAQSITLLALLMALTAIQFRILRSREDS